MTTKHAGIEGFRWFIATVESVTDPLVSGRVAIRLITEHDDTASILPADLLWGMPIVPPTAPSAKGLGSLHQLQVGMYVVGFFADGVEAQIPLIMGTWTASGDLPPEATGSTTAIKLPIGLEKPIKFGAKYPFNTVTKTKSGHMIEMDDTPSSERLHIYHKAGSYIEWDFMGSRVDGTIMNYHHSVGGIRNDFTKLIHNTTALGAINQIAGATYTVAAAGAASFNAGGTVGITSGLATVVDAGGLASILGGSGVMVKSPVQVNIMAPTITSTGGKVTMTGTANKMQKVELSDGVYNSIEYNSTINMIMNSGGVSATSGPAILNLSVAGGHADLLGTAASVTGTATALLGSPATTITGTTSTIINGGMNVLTMNGTGATWTTGNMQVTAAGYTNIHPVVKFDVRSAAVSTWSSAATSLESTTLFNILSGTTLGLVGTTSATLTSPAGTVSVGMGAGGIATTTNLGGQSVFVGGSGTTTTITIGATGAVTITAPAGAVEITAPVINMNGAVAVVGSLTLGGLPVKT